MKTYETLIADIRAEEHELNAKITKLETFMMTEDYAILSLWQRSLLVRQRTSMQEYKSILIDRAIRIIREHFRSTGELQDEEDPKERAE